jgi:hypothetical protein
MIDDFIHYQKMVRASMQARLEYLLAGFGVYEGRIGGPRAENISARQIDSLRGSIRQADSLIADYHASSAA